MPKIRAKYRVSRADLVRTVRSNLADTQRLAGSLPPLEAEKIRNAAARENAILLAVLRAVKLPAEVAVTHGVDE